jgi:hypothetical protein
MDNVLKVLRDELIKANDDTVKRDLRYAIHFVMKAIVQQKSQIKKIAKKIKQEAKERAEAMRLALEEIEKKRHRIK